MLKNLMNREDWSDKNVAQKGFTLIELLVVVAILGILAVVGVLAFGGLTQGAKDATKATELAEVKTATKAYTAKVGTPPADTAALETGNYIETGALKCVYTITAGVVAQGACTP